MKKHRLIAGILSVILSLLMVIGVFPVTDITASAATEITGITIVDVNIPRPGATPDYKVTYGAGCTSTTRFDSVSQINGIEWRYKRVNTWKVLKPTDTFMENVEYTVAIVVKAQNGYSFKTNNGSPSVSCTINGNRANVVGITGQNNRDVLVAIFTFPAAEYFTLNTVGVKSIETPQLGYTPDFTAEPISDRYTVSSLSWFDKTDLKYLSENDTFAENHSYMLTVTLNTLPGNKFLTDRNDIAAFTAKINGAAAKVVYSTTLGGTKASITAEYDVSPVISKISVSDIEIPKAGNRADYTCNINTPGYEIVPDGISWERQFAPNTDLQANDTFEAGKSYRLLICLKAKEGFVFKMNNGDVVAAAEINGVAAMIYNNVGNTYCEIAYFYTVPQDITSVAITDIAEPFAGETADMSGTVAGAGYEIANIEWYDSTDGHGNYINNITSFSEGREYTLNVYINTTDNNCFRLDPDYDIPDITAKINNKIAGVYSDGGRDEAIIYYRFKTPVEVVTVTGLTEPVAGQTPDMTAESTKAGYEIKKIEWFDNSVTPAAKLSETDKFVAGHNYTVQITLYACDDFIFNVEGGYQEITATINGKDAIEYGSDSYATAAIGYKFTVPAPHTHTPSGWKSDANGHWKECTDNTCKAVTEKKAAHEDKNGDEKCDTCSFPMPKPVVKELLLKTGCVFTVSHNDKTVIIPAGTKISDVKASILNEKYAVLTKDGKAAENTALTGTGMRIQVLGKDNSVLSTYKVIVLYDTDGNGVIQAGDARLTLRASVGLEDIKNEYLTASDINKTGKLEAADARSILRKSVGLED